MYCPICSACGVEGCCSPITCRGDVNGSFCQTYLRDLKFGYKLNLWFEKELYDKLTDEQKKLYDDMWDKTFDDTY